MEGQEKRVVESSEKSGESKGRIKKERAGEDKGDERESEAERDECDKY
jgi:hypothetical protein